MITVTIYHLDQLKLSVETRFNLDRQDFTLTTIPTTDLFTPIAAVDCNTADLYQALDMAYVATNHIETPWYSNPNVRMLIPPPYEVRSSSIGDIFRVVTTFFVVKPHGFLRGLTLSSDSMFIIGNQDPASS